MKAMSIKIKGEKELRAKLKKLNIDSKKAIGKALMKSADIVVEEAKIRAPFKTGALKKAIARDEPEVTKGGFNINIGIKIGRLPFTKKDAFYARFQELGTSKMSAHPYLRPALDSKKNSVIAKFMEIIRGFLK